MASDSKYAYRFRGDLLGKMVQLGHEVFAVTLDRDYEKQFSELGVSLVDISFNRTGTNPFADLSIIKKYEQIFNEYKPDYIYAFTAKPVIYGCIAAGRCGVKNIYPLIPGLGSTFGRTGFKGRIMERIMRGLYKYSLSFAKAVFFQNNDDISFFCKNKIILKEKCVRVNGSGVNMQHFAFCEMPDEMSFLLISRLLKSKGIMEYLRCAEKIKKNHPETVFRLIGGFDTNPESLKSEDISPYIDNGTIEYIGYVDDVYPYLCSSAVFVLPTYYNEGLPRSILEAMSVGRPVVTTAWKGSVDAVEHEKTGLLIPIKDEAALEKALLQVIDNKDKLAQMGKNAHERCKQLFEVGKVNESILKTMELL